LVKKHTKCLSQIPVGFGTNVNESLHKKMNATFHGIRLMSLEVVLAHLTIFFYEHNRQKQGGAEETWKTKVHADHSSPFTSYEHLDGVNTSNDLPIIRFITNIEQPSLEIVESYQQTLINVMHNIMSRSIMYNPLEVLLHCSFKGFSFPPSLNGLDISDEMLNDLSLESDGQKQDIIEAIMKQASYAGSFKNNENFHDYLMTSFSKQPNPRDALKSAVLREMSMCPDLYCHYFPSTTRFNETLSCKELDIYSSAGINTICASISVVLKSVVVYVFPNSTEKFHVSAPVLNSDRDRLINNIPLFLRLDYTDGKLTFSCTNYKLLEEVPNPVIEDESFACVTPNDSKCCCGKGRKNTTVSCISSRCPCVKTGSSCGAQCACQLCENVNGRRLQETQKRGRCWCRENNQSKDKSFCISSQCYCRKYGFSCTMVPMCACKNCENVLGATTGLEEPPKKRQATERNMFLQKSSGKLPDISSHLFFKKTGQKIVQSIWSDEENLLLKSLMSYLLISERHIQVKTITNMFNSYSVALQQIRNKTLHQVAFKIRHTNAIRNVCNS
jgi:hypothetical protein